MRAVGAVGRQAGPGSGSRTASEAAGGVETAEVKAEVPEQLLRLRGGGRRHWTGRQCQAAGGRRACDPRSPEPAPPRLAGTRSRLAGRPGPGMPVDRRTAVTEIHSELQLVAVSFSGAPAN